MSTSHMKLVTQPNPQMLRTADVYQTLDNVKYNIITINYVLSLTKTSEEPKVNNQPHI